MLPSKTKIRQEVWPQSYWANFGKYEKTIANTFFRSSISFNKFAGNHSTLVSKTLIFGNKMAIFEFHNTLEAAYILTKKQLAENVTVKAWFFTFTNQ